MRRALSLVPFAPIVVICGLVGWAELCRDMHRQACRFFEEMFDEIESNK